jgi:hypothetical protein
MIGWQALFELGPHASPPRQKHERLQLALPELTHTMGQLTAMKEEWQTGMFTSAATTIDCTPWSRS